MSKYVISAENLGKHYHITSATKKKKKGQMLRDALSETVAGSMDALRTTLGLPISTNREGWSRSFWALRDVNFQIEAGDSVGVIGSNGAGKSTLLKILSRITAPTTGKVHLRGRVGSLLEVGTGFHQELTGRENIYLNGAILGMRRREIDRKFDEIVAFSEVEEFLDTPVKFFSTGMRMRLAFSVAAHLEPEILLIDEVLAVGDAAFQKKSLSKMGDVIGDGRTVLFVSHNMGAVRALCQKAIFLEKGMVKAIGSVDEVSDSYLRATKAKTLDYRPSEIDLSKGGQILSATLLDKDGRTLDSFPHDEPFSVRLKIVIHRTVQQLYVSLIIYTSTLEGILVSHDFELDEEKLLARVPGIYGAHITIPAPLLAPGQYFIGFAVSRVKMSRQSRLGDDEHLTPFEIYDHGSALARSNIAWKGIVHIPLKWKYLSGDEAP